VAASQVKRLVENEAAREAEIARIKAEMMRQAYARLLYAPANPHQSPIDQHCSRAPFVTHRKEKKRLAEELDQVNCTHVEPCTAEHTITLPASIALLLFLTLMFLELD
jgi:hypothetical protein